MTQNQLAYWQLQEAKRTNVANERIKSRSADASQLASDAKMLTAQTQQQQLAETIRHNKVSEKVDMADTALGGITSIVGTSGRIVSSVIGGKKR